MGREECYHDGSGLWTHCERKDSCTHLKCASVATVSRVWTVSLASPLSSSPSVLAAFLHTPSDPVAWAIHQLTKGKNKPWIMVLVFFLLLGSSYSYLPWFHDKSFLLGANLCLLFLCILCTFLPSLCCAACIFFLKCPFLLLILSTLVLTFQPTFHWTCSIHPAKRTASSY